MQRDRLSWQGMRFEEMDDVGQYSATSNMGKPIGMLGLGF